jgi:hypothetical protein
MLAVVGMDCLYHPIPGPLAVEHFANGLIEDTGVAVGTGFDAMVFEIPFAVSDLRDLFGAIEQLVSMAQSFEFRLEYGDTRLFSF